MLERGGMWGGGWCQNSVKTSIFKNSVSSLEGSSFLPSQCMSNHNSLHI
jgi:hypothetical protein